MSQAAAITSAASRPVRLRARADLVARPQQYRRERYWVVKDPLALKYVHLPEEEYALLQRLDGGASLDELQKFFAERFAPRRVTLENLQGFLNRLYRQGLVVAEARGQGDVLLELHSEERRKKWLFGWMQILALRFRGWDPERFLNATYPFVRFAFAPWCVALCVLLMASAALLAFIQLPRLLASLPALETLFHPQHLLVLVCVIAGTKLLHELGHAYACKHFGGECHEIGPMLLVFTPTLYCNVSDAWMLPNKYHRMAIAAAGMYVEGVLAAVCAFLWWWSQPGLIQEIALNVMIVCSVNTLLFNGNPFLRYDGYYILADAIEVPNLRQRAGAALGQIFSRLCLGIAPSEDRTASELHPGWLALYGAAAFAYRVFVVLAISWFCLQMLKPYRLEIFGQMLAMIALAGLFVAPMMFMVRQFQHPLARRKIRWPRVAVSLFVLALALAAIAWLRLPHRVEGPVVLEPRDASRVYVHTGGTLERAVAPGTQVAAGDVLAVLIDEALEREVMQLVGERNRLRARLAGLQARQATDAEAALAGRAAEEALAAAEARLARRRADLNRLTIRAPRAGTVLPPPGKPAREASQASRGMLSQWSGSPLDPENLGCYLERNELLCMIGEPQAYQALMLVGQADVPYLQRPDIASPLAASLALDALPGQIVTGRVIDVARMDAQTLPRPLATQAALVARTDPLGRPLAADTVYQVAIALDDDRLPVPIGAVGRAKISVEAVPLGTRFYRFLRRTFYFEM